MTLKEFANMLDGREYRNEITPEEEKLAKKLGFVVVFGYSDDNAELRGAIDDEIGCFDGGLLEHDDLPAPIYADWCPEDIDCCWAYGTSIPYEKFYIYEHNELYCVGIVCDINKQNQPDLVEVVRCKDCKHCTPSENIIGGYGDCNRFERDNDNSIVCEDDFCSYGERREGE